MRWCWGHSGCLVWRKGGSEVTSLLPTSSWRGEAEGDAGLLSLGSDNRTVGNCTKLCQLRFKLHIRKHFFTLRAVKHCNRLPRDVVNAPCLSELKRLKMLSIAHFNFWLALKCQAVGLDDLWRSFPTEQFYFFSSSTVNCFKEQLAIILKVDTTEVRGLEVCPHPLPHKENR